MSFHFLIDWRTQTGEPNNAGGNEHCVYVIRTGQWNDAPCTGSVSSLLCEQDAIIISSAAPTRERTERTNSAKQDAIIISSAAPTRKRTNSATESRGKLKGHWKSITSFYLFISNSLQNFKISQY